MPWKRNGWKPLPFWVFARRPTRQIANGDWHPSFATAFITCWKVWRATFFIQALCQWFSTGGHMAPQGGIYKSWGGIQSIWGIGEEWTPSGGGDQQIAINRPGCSSGWHIVAASPVFVDVTLRPEGSSALPQDTVPRPKWTLGLWRTTFLAPRHSYFWQKWKCMHYRHNEFQNFLQNLALDAHDGLHRKSTLAFIRHCSRVGGGGNDKLPIDKGGNLPEKVENHCSMP